MILGLHGRLGSGKDTVLERMQVLYPGEFVRHSFADRLKASACALLDIDLELMEQLKRDEDFNFLSIWDPAMEREGSPLVEMTMRTFLQRFGTEAHRDVFGDSFWVDQAMGPALEDEARGLTVVYSDLRFSNEGEAVLARGGTIWLVQGPVRDTGTHASETPLPDSMISFVLDNTNRTDGFASLDRQIVEEVERLKAARYI